MKAKAEAMKPGLPNDAGVDFGPLISAEHQGKVLDYYRLAEQEGVFTDPRIGRNFEAKFIGQ